MSGSAAGRSRRTGGPGAVAAVALGSNLGDRHENLRFGVRELERLLARLVVSRAYRSPPREGAEGGEFLNLCAAGVLEQADCGDPRRLLRQLQFVELAAGRPPSREPGAARTLDLDLLLVGDRTVETSELCLPHPRMTERSFVLTPLAEVLPEWEHPAERRPVRALAGAVGRGGEEPVEEENIEF